MCWDAPCTRACPTSIDVPGFIKRIASGDDLGAARLILSSNVLGNSCAHACPTEVMCEGACVMNDVDGRPVAIGKLQGHATAPIVGAGIQTFAPAPSTGKRVAVVGAGPAGLACAAELVRLGHAAVAFESGSVPGGLNTHGVASYKVSQTEALAEIEWIESSGVEIRRETAVGEAISTADLIDEFDALFIGIGLGRIRPLDIPGVQLPGTVDALTLIAAAKSNELREDAYAGRTVLVLGGGNTAVDAARLARRLGASNVTIVYRRDRDHMPAYEHEIEEAIAEGVQFAFWFAPAAIEGEARVEALVCEHTAPGAPGPDGRPSIVATGELTSLWCDVIVVATGQETHDSLLAGVEGLELDRHGWVVVDGEQRASHPAIWAGGDCANGGQEVVNAVAEGMAAARSIDRSLSRKG